MTRQELCDQLLAVHNHIPGKCSVWARRTSGDDRSWSKMGYAGRNFYDCIDLVAYYEEEWGSHYEYRILSSAHPCRPN